MRTLPEISLKEGLKLWSKTKEVSLGHSGEHFSPAELLRAVEAGGMDRLSEERKEHLSLCSDCLQKWLDITEEQGFVEELAEEKSSDDWYSGGMMEAAAGEVRSALSLKSRCGNFQITLYPDEVKRGEGMVSLDYVGSSGPDIEGKTVTVKDMNGLILLESSIRSGRAASFSDKFAIMDLQAWSIHVQGSSDGDTTE